MLLIKVALQEVSTDNYDEKMMYGESYRENTQAVLMKHNGWSIHNIFC